MTLDDAIGRAPPLVESSIFGPSVNPYLTHLTEIVPQSIQISVRFSTIMRDSFHLFTRMKNLKIISVNTCLDIQEHFGGLLNLHDSTSQWNFYFQERPFDKKLSFKGAFALGMK